MNDNPETPSGGMGEAGAEVPRTDGTPTSDITGSYSPPPAQSTPSNWQPGQYSADQSSGTPPTPPSYSQTPSQPAETPPNYSYGYPPSQGQPTQYMPPQQYGQQGNMQGGPPTSPQAQPPSYQPGNYSGVNPQYTPQPVAYGYGTPKDPTVGLLLELIGYLGFLGIGHIYAGKTARGIGLMVGFWVYLIVSGILTVVLIGCVMLVAGLAIPLASGFYLKNEMEKEQAAMGIRR
jgi:hypothetical protein